MMLWVAMAHGQPLDPAEHLLYWIDEGITPPAAVEEWAISRVFRQDDELPLDLGKAVSAVAVHGRLDIVGDEGHVRITLIDGGLREYLVAEFYPLMMKRRSLALRGVCRETCLLGGVSPHRLRIDLADAALTIDHLEVMDLPESPVIDLADRQEEIRSSQADAIVGRINAQIEVHHLDWEAGKTAYALLTFEERKGQSAARGVPVFHGFEYYVDGTFELPVGGGGGVASDSLIAHFDWRKRHNAHLRGSPYYDGDPTGSGWMTPCTMQLNGCADCWAHTAIGLLEGHINLALNRQRDVDLSEQHVLSCSGAGTCRGGTLSDTLDYMAQRGAVSEHCFTYQGADVGCEVACNHPTLTARIGRVIRLSPGGDERVIKRALMDYGPLAFRRDSWWHYMVMTGFDRDRTTGRTVWIVKNSWGASWGQAGFGRIKARLDDFDSFYAVTGVKLLNRGVSVKSRCRDEDGDGYAVWGLGRQRPSNCYSRDGLPDCNDDNPRRGPALPSGRCVLLSKSSGGSSEPVPPSDATVIPDRGESGGGATGFVLLAILGIARCCCSRSRVPRSTQAK